MDTFTCCRKCGGKLKHYKYCLRCGSQPKYPDKIERVWKNVRDPATNAENLPLKAPD